MTPFPLLHAVSRHWWVLLLRGIIGILFGIVALTLPGLTLATLVILYGIFALVDGIVTLWIGGGSKEWGLMFAGILGVLAGLCALVYPGITLLVLYYIIAIWAIIRGVFEIAAAIRLRHETRHEWLLIISGVFSILLGVIFLANPLVGLMTIIWLVGIYAILFGGMMIGWAFRVRKVRDRLERPAAAA